MIRPHFSNRLAFAGLVSLSWMLHSSSTARAEAVATFQSMGLLPGGYASVANAVSADGSVVVGEAFSSTTEAFRWTSGTGMVGLGGLPGGASYSGARDTSSDGSVVVGEGVNASDRSEAFRWSSDTGMVGLGGLSGESPDSVANGTSSDGSVVVGFGFSASGIEAFRWTSGTGMVGLGDLPEGLFNSVANGVSADGSVVVGFGFSATGGEAFRWTSETGMVGLGDLPGGTFGSAAFGTSSDGSVVVGHGTSASGTEAFRWTSETGMIGLGDLPGGAFGSRARAISSDGAVVVGYSAGDSGQEAFLWTADGGMQMLAAVLEEFGATPTGFTSISDALDIEILNNTATVVGSGFNGSGTEAFRAQIPIVSASLADELLSLTPGLTSDMLALDVSETKLLYGDISRYEFDFTTDGIYDLTLDVGTPLFDAYWDAMSESFLFSEGDIRTYYAAINAGDFGSLTFDTRIRMTHENGTAINTSDAVITVVPEVSSLGLFVTACLFGTGIMAIRRHSTQ